MEFDIKELTIAILVGSFAIIGFEAILEFFFFGGPLNLFATWMSERAVQKGVGHHPGKKVEERLIMAAVFILAAFTLGVFAEDISQKKMYEAPLKPFLRYLNFLDDVDDRALSLIQDFSKPSALARDLAANGGLVISDATKPGESSGPGRKVQDWIRNGSNCFPEPKLPTCPSSKEVEYAALNLYYYAKNTVYLHPDAPSAASDLKAFEDRITFERSIAVIAIIYSAIAVPLFLILVTRRAINMAAKHWPRMNKFLKWLQAKRSGLWVRIRRILEEEGQPPESTKNHAHRKPYALRIEQLVLMLALIMVSILGLWAYGRETDAFNKRAFGYFSTMLISENRKREANWISGHGIETSTTSTQKMRPPE